MEAFAQDILERDEYPASVTRFKHFAWLIENQYVPRTPFRLVVLWQWAGEMDHFQQQANSTGKPVEYTQRGEVVRTLYPAKTGDA